jgi:ATP synthase protein I
MSDDPRRPSLEDVETRLKTAEGVRREATARSESRRASAKSQSIGFRIAAELVAAVLVGGAIGYGLDLWLETAPVFMVLMLLLGFAAALMNIFRIMRGMDQAVGLGRAMRESKKAGQDDDDDEFP